MSESMVEDKKYLRKKVNPLLELMVAELMKKQPEEPVSFMKKWLQENGRAIEAKINEREQDRPEGILTTSESEGDEGEELDEVHEQVQFQKLVNKNDYKNMRISVSAEAYGEFNRKEHFKPPVYPKNQEQCERIRHKLRNSFLFTSLQEKEAKIIIEAMKEVRFEPGEVVIRQGDKGDNLFVVDSGTLDCSKMNPGEPKPKFLLTYKPGDAFGELALLYNAPRAATIVTTSPCVLFSLDRETFNHIVKDAVMRRRQEFHSFSSKIEVLKSLNEMESDKVCDCLQLSHFKPGEYVIRQGDKGDVFFLIQSGNCIATQTGPDGSEKTVYQFGPNDYFGELALLRDEPRAANVVATSDLTLASIDRAAFKRLLGPVEKLLERNTQRYQ